MYPLRVAAFVGIDVGTSGVKAIAIRPTGEVIARAEHNYPLSTPRPGWSEQDPELWWDAAQASLAALAARGANDIRGIGLSGQMHGLVCLDAHDRVLRPAILWNDQRTSAECAEIEQRIGLDRLIQLTGNRALTGFTAPKLLWMRRHEPDIYARIAHVLLPKDYVRLRLTGERAIDVADASGTLLFDVAGRRWSDDVTNALGVPDSWLPTALESPEVSGRTRDGVPIAAGAGDQAAGALGVGVDRPGPLSVVLGTSGVVFAALPRFVADPEARVHVFCHAVPASWHAMGVMLSAAGSLQWFRDALAADAPYADLDTEAARWEAGSEGLFFLPYLAGERTPHSDPGARGAFIGLSIRHDRGAMVRAVMEGVAYGLRDSFELVTALGMRAETGRASGGGARSRLWLSIVATTLNVPIELTAVEEGAAYGAALLGAVAGGEFADVRQAVDACVRVRDVIEPDAARKETYAEGYLRFRELYPALREVSFRSRRPIC